MQKKPNKKKTEDSNSSEFLSPVHSFTLFFAEASEFNSDFLKNNKKLNKMKLNTVEYLLALPKEEKLSKKYSRKFISLLLFDIKVQSSTRGSHYLKKEKELLLFTYIDDKEILFEVFSLKDKSKISLFAENYFAGYPYVEITDGEKVLSSIYQESDFATMVVLLVLILAMFGYIYSSFIYKEPVAIISPKKAEPPIVKPFNAEEIYVLKNALSLKVLNSIENEINRYEDKAMFDIQRIANIQMSTVTKKSPAQPVYVEKTNSWEYSPREKKYARGGYETKLTITYQKKFPSVGYKLESSGNKEKIALYRKIKTIPFSVGLNVLKDDNMTVNSLDSLCLNKTLSMVDTILPSEHNAEYLHFTVKNTFPSNIYRNIKAMFKKCPLELDNIAISGGLLNLKIKIKK